MVVKSGGCSVLQAHVGRTFGLLAMILALVSPVAMSEGIRIGGTGNALGTMHRLAAAFGKKYPAVKIDVLSSLGSSGALKALAKGAIDIALSSRLPTSEELACGLRATEYARSATVLAVSVHSKVTDITSEQIADLYAGRLAEWPDGTRIRPVLRQPGEDNTMQIKALSPAIEQALSDAERRPGLALAATDQETADKIESIPGAIGVSTLALIRSEGRALRALKLNGSEATERNGVAGTYPIVKPFYFVTQVAPSVAVRQFVDFVGSAAGRDILTQNGNWSP